jgi:hypothetical protein
MAGSQIASDLNNPDFVGATNPDARLAVIFYSKPMQNEFESNKQGRPIFEDRDMVKIFVPGDNNSVIDTFVRDDHKQRFPLQWAHFLNRHSGDSREIGTPLSAWPRLSPAQVEELRALKFFTVENVANASDLQLQSLGMAAGMAPHAFRDHAIRFLKVAREDSTAQASEERIKALESEKEQMKADFQKQMEDMQAQVSALVQNVARRPRKQKGDQAAA